MRRWQLIFNRWLNRKLTKISTTRLIAVAFALIILTGTLLLMTPAASRSGIGCSFRGALFTATSATCVTGLTLFDTWTQWSGFGQVVILCLIEIGGLGFMSAASIFVFLLRRRVGMKQRLVMAQSLSVDDMSSVVGLQKVVLKGSLGIHPGAAKNKLINASQVAMDFHAMLPVHERPESTEGYEGFCMLNNISGGIEETVMHYIIRDHDEEKFEEKKDRFYQIAVYLDSIYGDGTVEVEMNDSYYNMRQKIEPVMYIVDRAKAAMERLGITPYSVPVRGGTDGARLSYMGLPCPNLCTGGMNFHGRYEYAVVEEMEACARILVEILTDPGL